MPITPLFVAIFALFYLYLSFSVIRLRLKNEVSLGSAGHQDLENEIRAHANFIEYVPMALLLMWFTESFVFDSQLTLILGCILFISRISHMIGIRDTAKYMRFRQAGAIGTFMVLLIGALRIIWHYVPL